MSNIDQSRHLQFFDPSKFPDRIDVVGVGAVGSRIAEELVNMSFENIVVWDFDVVEPHNISNQVFGVPDIGKEKTVALNERVGFLTNGEYQVTAKGKLGDEIDSPLGKVVFLCVDDLQERERIVRDHIANKYSTDLIIDVRMGVTEMKCYAIESRNMDQLEAWYSTIVPPDQTMESSCSSRQSVGSTAMILAGLAVHKFRTWNNFDRSTRGLEEDCMKASFEDILLTEPLMAMST